MLQFDMAIGERFVPLPQFTFLLKQAYGLAAQQVLLIIAVMEWIRILREQWRVVSVVMWLAS
jgi:hypothetical protein